MVIIVWKNETRSSFVQTNLMLMGTNRVIDRVDGYFIIVQVTDGKL